MVSATPRTYRGLLAELQPRSISCEREAETVRETMNAFLDREDLNDDEWQFLALLGDLLSAWERTHYPLHHVPVPQRIQALLEAHNLRQKDLVGPVFSTESVASEVLHGRRNLSYDTVRRLAAFFHASPAVFYPAADDVKFNNCPETSAQEPAPPA